MPYFIESKITIAFQPPIAKPSPNQRHTDSNPLVRYAKRPLKPIPSEAVFHLSNRRIEILPQFMKVRSKRTHCASPKAMD